MIARSGISGCFKLSTPDHRNGCRLAVAYYCNRLGFTKHWQFGGDGLTIAQVSRR